MGSHFNKIIMSLLGSPKLMLFFLFKKNKMYILTEWEMWYKGNYLTSRSQLWVMHLSLETPYEDGSPRAIIARFLRYGDRELIFSKMNQEKDSGYQVSAYLPREIVN